VLRGRDRRDQLHPRVEGRGRRAPGETLTCSLRQGYGRRRCLGFGHRAHPESALAFRAQM